MKHQSKISPTSLTERLRDQNPAMWHEFQELERIHCTPHGQCGAVALGPNERSRLDTLTTFFAIESSRKVYSTALIHLDPVKTKVNKKAVNA